MANSHESYEDRIGKYKAGNTLIQGWADYNSTFPLVTKSANNAFITVVENANINVVQKKQIDDNLKQLRLLLSFTQYDNNQAIGIINPDCAEQRMVRVLSYVTGLLAEDSPTTDAIKTIVHKIRPQYRGTVSENVFTVTAGGTKLVNNVVNNSLATNVGTVNMDWSEPGGTNPPETVNPGEETTIISPSGNVLLKNDSNIKAGKFKMTIKTGKAETNSPMEKTFASVVGFLGEVIALINGIGGGIVYSPPDPKLTVAELTALRNQIDNFNSQVATAMSNYGEANQDRRKLYDGNDGMVERIRLIKLYLATFPLGKKSSHFIEFSQAIKGT